MTAAGRGMGLRERKKLRTRKAIERTALDLFAERGFEATTLAQIAEAAEVAPATLYAYFPSKDDLLFVTLDAACESARRRIVGRPEGQTVVDALQGWLTEELPLLTEEHAAWVRLRRSIVDGSAALLAEERLRLAQLEDLFAEAFARDLDETSDDLRSRLMAAVMLNGLRATWTWWFRHADDEDDASAAYALDATYVTSLLEAAEHALEALPTPQEHARANGR